MDYIITLVTWLACNTQPINFLKKKKNSHNQVDDIIKQFFLSRSIRFGPDVYVNIVLHQTRRPWRLRSEPYP